MSERITEKPIEIVTDSGCDLSAEQLNGLPVTIVPLSVSLENEVFDKRNPITHQEFYRRISASKEYPKTSQVSIGDFVETYREIAARGARILSIHISGSLSGTLRTARAAAKMVSVADVTFFDSKTLTAGLGWQVQAAGLAIKNNWRLDRILESLGKIRDQVDSQFTLKELRYLVAGGRISHLKGLVAQVLNIKPIIIVDHEHGRYEPGGQAMSFNRALDKIVELKAKRFGSVPLRAQVVHGQCPDGAAYLMDMMKKKLNVIFEEVVPIAPVLGAHTGPSLVGLIIGPQSLFKDLIPA